MNRKKRRLVFIAIIGSVLAFATGLVLYAVRDKILFFQDPTEVITGNKVKPDQRFRLGGLVKEGSLKKGEGKQISFTITDLQHEVPVTFVGILPALFREGQGVITEGKLDNSGLFNADTVLAKHDENYMPKEIADSLKEKGVWQGEEVKSQ